MSKRPNIIYILADDLGFGDVSCLNPDGKIETRHIDRIGREGMVFTDAHSSSSVCTPSRYSVLTGRYNWRSQLQAGIVGVYSDALIARDRLTVPGLLGRHGYRTGCIGKWHLGQGWAADPGDRDFLPEHKYNSSPEREAVATDHQRERWSAAFSQGTTDGPTTRGFDEYFGVDIPNWPPYCFLENDQTVGTPSEFLQARQLGDNQGSLQGPAVPHWNFEQLLPTWGQKSKQFISRCVDDSKPFFLYLALTSPHTPISVNKRFIGKSGLNNLYADFVLETDHVVGEILTYLDELDITDNTMVVFTSDNGCTPEVGTDRDGLGNFESAMEPQGHHSSGPYRGYKSDAWDGGHRIPLVVRWPNTIKPESECRRLVCLSDLMSTCAEILGERLPDDAGEDSVSMMPLFTDPAAETRQELVHHSISGKFAIRSGRWKLVLCPGSGGWSHRDHEAAEDGYPLVQLYDMQSDPGETKNLCDSEKSKVRQLIDRLQAMIDSGRSTPGPPQNNDADIDIWKLDSMPSVTQDSLQRFLDE